MQFLKLILNSIFNIFSTNFACVQKEALQVFVFMMILFVWRQLSFRPDERHFSFMVIPFEFWNKLLSREGRLIPSYRKMSSFEVQIEHRHILQMFLEQPYLCTNRESIRSYNASAVCLCDFWRGLFRHIALLLCTLDAFHVSHSMFLRDVFDSFWIINWMYRTNARNCSFSKTFDSE